MDIDDVKPTLAQYLEGDLGPARRHLHRIERGELQPSRAVLKEISQAIERCVERIRRDVK